MEKHQHNFLWSPSDPASRALIVDWMKRRNVYSDERFWPTFVNLVNKTVDTMHHHIGAPPEYEPADLAAIMQSSLPVEDLLEMMEWFLGHVYGYGPNDPQFIMNGLIKAHDYGNTQAINEAQTRLQGKVLHLKAKWATALMRSQHSTAPEGNARARRNAARKTKFALAGQSSQSSTEATQQSQIATLPEFSVADMLGSLPAAGSPPAERADEGGVLLKQHSEMVYRPKP